MKNIVHITLAILFLVAIGAMGLKCWHDNVRQASPIVPLNHKCKIAALSTDMFAAHGRNQNYFLGGGGLFWPGTPIPHTKSPHIFQKGAHSMRPMTNSMRPFWADKIH